MSISTVKAALATRLALVNPAPQPVLARIYNDPAEALNIADFPSAVLVAPAAGQRQGFDDIADGFTLHNYVVDINVFIGPRETPLPELYARLEPWPLAILVALKGNIKLSGACNYIGNQRGDQRFFDYEVGPIEWAGDDYYGLVIHLPVQEAISVTTA